MVDEPANNPHASRRVAKLDVRMLELLACPVTKGLLRYDAEHEELISPGARLAYPVRDGIPILLQSEARVIELD